MAASIAAGTRLQTSSERRKQPRHLQLWKVTATARIEELADEIAVFRARDGDINTDALGRAEKRLWEAKASCAPDSGLWGYTGGRLVEYFTGVAQEKTWNAIHEADVVLTYARSAEHIRAELPGLKQTVRRRVDDELYREDLLERLKSIEKPMEASVAKLREARRSDEPPGGSGSPSGLGLTLEDADRTAVAHAKQEAYQLMMEGYESKRSFRNVIILTTLIAALAALLLGILGEFDKTIQNRLDVYPHTPGEALWPATIWQVELIGALAGFIVAIGVLGRLRGQGPYSLRVAQAALKVPTGALTALVGMLMLQSETFGIGPVETKVAFVGWAIVFGASQELITRLVDQKAAAVVEKAEPTGS